MQEIPFATPRIGSSSTPRVVFTVALPSGYTSCTLLTETDIYGHGAKVKKYKNYKVLAQQAPNTLTLRDKVQHGRRRRVLSQAFSKEGLKTLEPSILAQLDCFVELLRSQVGPGCKWSAPVDMAHACKSLSFTLALSRCLLFLFVIQLAISRLTP